METLLEKEVLAKTADKAGRITISCDDALAIAHLLQIDPKEVGGFCNDRKIKVVSCKLGCFA